MLKSRKIALISVFLTLWAIIYVLYLSNVISTNHAYFSIFLCTAFSCVIPRLRGEKWDLSDILLTVSLALVAVADVFMGFFDGDPKFVTAGVAFFSIVQLTYFCCMTARRGGKPAFRDRHFKISLIVRAAATIAIIGVCIALFLLENGVFFSKPYLIIITGFYFVNAVVNLAYACVYIKQNPVVPAAILLLVLCDTFLGLTFLGIFSGGGYLSKVNISWILYLPSQALITLSGLYKRNLSPVLRPAEPQKDDVSRKHFYENNLENSAANNLGNVNENE